MYNSVTIFLVSLNRRMQVLKRDARIRTRHNISNRMELRFVPRTERRSILMRNDFNMSSKEAGLAA